MRRRAPVSFPAPGGRGVLAAQKDPAPRSPKLRSAGSEERPQRRPPPLVLIVDDDRGMRDSLAMVLENEGLEAMLARHGAEALEWLRGSVRRPDLIILDLMMPVMNGWDFRSAQLADPQLAAIPTLVLTADSDALFRPHELAVSHALHKPIELGALFETIGQLIPHWKPED